MVSNMSVEEIIAVLKDHFFFILSMIIGCMLLAFLITVFLITPRYEANTQILVSESEVNAPLNNQNIEASLQLMNTYRDLLLSPIVLDEVVERLSLNETSEDLAAALTVFQEENSQVLNITAVDNNPKTAEAMSNEVANVFHEKVSDVMNVDNVTIISPARLPENPNPIFPNTVLITIIGGGLGAIIALIISFFKIIFDRKIRDEEDVQKHLGIPVLGSVAKFK